MLHHQSSKKLVKILETLYQIIGKPVFLPDRTPIKWIVKHTTLLYLSLFNLAEQVKCVAKQALNEFLVPEGVMLRTC